MTATLQVGPLALPVALLATLGAIAIGWALGIGLGQRARVDVEPLLLRVLAVGVVAARLAFVWQWRGAYSGAPWSILDLRDGGWDAASGVGAALLYALWQVRGRGAARRPVLAAVATSGVLFAVAGFAVATWTRSDATLPRLELTSLDGAPVSVAGFAGRPTVINLWASWCPPCRREMPVLAQAQRDAPDLNVVFVNQGEAPSTIARFLDGQGLALGNVLVDDRLQAGAAFDQRALPTTLFFDAGGRLVSTRIGELSRATLAQRVAEARAAAPPDRPSVPR